MFPIFLSYFCTEHLSTQSQWREIRNSRYPQWKPSADLPCFQQNYLITGQNQSDKGHIEKECLKILIQSRCPDKSKQELDINDIAYLVIQNSPVQCEFLGMNCKFLQTQALTPLPELLGSKYETLLLLSKLSCKKLFLPGILAY